MAPAFSEREAIAALPKCIAGSWVAQRGCVASRPWSMPAVPDAPASQLESRLKTAPPRDELALAVALARSKPAAQRATWYRRAVAAFARIPAPADAEAVDLVAEAEASLAIAALESTISNDSLMQRCPASVARDLFDWPEDQFGPASKGAWNELRRKTTEASTPLVAVSKKSPQAAWSAIALSCIGLLFVQLRETLAACDADTTIALFSAKEKEFLGQLSTSPRYSAQVADIRIAKRGWFEAKKTEGLHDLQVEAIRSLAAGLALARSIGVSNAVVSDATAALTHFRTTLGDETMTRVLHDQPDPTDPDRKRSLGANFEVLTNP